MKSFWYYGNDTSFLSSYTCQHNFFLRKFIKFSFKKISPFFTDFQASKKPRARHGNKINYLISDIESVITVQSGTYAHHGNVALEAQCKYLSEGLKNKPKNLVSTKREGLTARTGIDLCPSILLYLDD